mgnify:CR=1 FL=1
MSQEKKAEADDDPSSMGKGAERIYTIASTGSEVTPKVFGWGLVGSIIFYSVLGFIIGLLSPITTLLDGRYGSLRRAYSQLTNIFWIIPALTLVGAAYGAWDYGKRAVALRRGKADYLASQEDT